MMVAWKILLIVLLCTVVAGVFGGMIIGKYILRDKNKPTLLSLQEKIVYACCILLGLAFILIGVFVTPSISAQNTPDDESYLDGETAPVGDFIEEPIDGGDWNDTDGYDDDIEDDGVEVTMEPDDVIF